jgi:hypothetical protein
MIHNRMRVLHTGIASFSHDIVREGQPSATWGSYGSQGRLGVPSSLLEGATQTARHNKCSAAVVGGVVASLDPGKVRHPPLPSSHHWLEVAEREEGRARVAPFL